VAVAVVIVTAAAPAIPPATAPAQPNFPRSYQVGTWAKQYRRKTETD
jgi:hypothetical protein